MEIKVKTSRCQCGYYSHSLGCTGMDCPKTKKINQEFYDLQKIIEYVKKLGYEVHRYE